MADNYYEATGVLVLDHVTPVIRALFSEFRLDADYPGNGEAYIALRSDSTPSWDDLRETLTDLATSLALTPSPDTLTPFGEGVEGAQRPLLRRRQRGIGIDDPAGRLRRRRRSQ